MAGDFICHLGKGDLSPNTHLNNKSRNAVKSVLTKFNLCDVWWDLAANNCNHYTWQDRITASRLDYYICQQEQFPND